MKSTLPLLSIAKSPESFPNRSAVSHKTIEQSQVSANPRFQNVFNTSASFILADFLKTLFPHKPDYLEQLDAWTALIFDSELDHIYDFQISRNQGEQQHYQIHRILDEQNIWLIFVDITQSLDRIQSLRRNNELIREFFTLLSHELRTPINGILGNAQLLSRVSTLNQQHQHQLKVIQDCGMNVLRLVNDILSLAKLDAKTFQFKIAPFRLASVLDSIEEIGQIDSPQKGIEFIYHPHLPFDLRIEGDEVRLRQILMNLLSNAIKFTDQGTVTFSVEILTLSPESVFLAFGVKDTGIGISKADLDKLFQSFVQVGKTVKQNEGTGLGLAISQRLAHGMGGHISVQSQEGIGSTFQLIVSCPINQQPVILSSIQNLQAIPERRFAGIRVLLLNLGESHRKTMMQFFSSTGAELSIQTIVTFDPTDFENTPPHLVIVDEEDPVILRTEMMPLIQDSEWRREPKVFWIGPTTLHTDTGLPMVGDIDQHFLPPLTQDLFMAMTTYHLQDFCAFNSPEDTKTIHPYSLPSIEVLQQLRNTVGDGFLHEFTQQLQQLLQENPQYSALILPLQNLASNFQVEQIEFLLDKHISNKKIHH